MKVHIELQRVQTMAPAESRLRAMIGANGLLGETLRIALPNLARETGRGWVLLEGSEKYPIADGHDLLKEYDDRRDGPVICARPCPRVRNASGPKVRFAFRGCYA